MNPNKSTKGLAELILCELKTEKPDAAEAILQKIHEVAEDIQGKFMRGSGVEVGRVGSLYIPSPKFGEWAKIEARVGYNDGSWWFYSSDCGIFDKKYCSGDIQEFVQTLKDFAAELKDPATWKSPFL